MYVLYLHLKDFLDHAGPVVHLQSIQSSTRLFEVSAVFLTSQVDPYGPVHGARIVVVREPSPSYEAGVTDACVVPAVQCLADAITDRGRLLEPGVCLVPGLFDDLEKIVTAQHLWTTRRNGHNSWEVVVADPAVS